MSLTQTQVALKPGVVTGNDYKALIAACKNGGYALPAVNVTTSNTINAVLEAAAKSKSDVIIQLSNGGAEFFAGKGFPDSSKAKAVGAIAAAQLIHTLAKYYGVCVGVHTDHANKELIPWVDALIDAGEEHFKKTGAPLFSSHMLDLSEEPLDWNIAQCEKTLRRIAPLGMSLELELGVTGGEEDGVGKAHDGADNAKLYTQPEDVLQAYERLTPIGHFSVAASFGNVHGVYAPGNVKLRPEILKNSQALVQKTKNTGKNPLNLVFHGGSGSEKEKISEAVSYGVFKMNIDTDTQFAFSKPIGDFVKKNPKAFDYQIDPVDGTPYKKLYDPRKYLRLAEQGVVERLAEAFKDLGSFGKTLAR